jgi:hypothetical protein
VRATLTCVRGPSSRMACRAVALVYDSAASDPQDRTAASIRPFGTSTACPTLCSGHDAELAGDQLGWDL